MVQINDKTEHQISADSIGMPLVITASNSETMRLHDPQDIYELLSAISKVVAILNAPKE